VTASGAGAISAGVSAPTLRLDWEDPACLEFTARVVAHGELGGRASLVLDRTAFYPESGGQMADHGELGGVTVVDVQVDDEGVVHHFFEGAAPAVGAELAGRVDRTRRRVHRALHTAQHVLSRALLDVAAAETVSSRLGESACTVDVNVAGLDERAIARAEQLANDVVDDDVTVRAFFPDPAELAALPLRRAPKVEERVRVVAIGDFDVSPCGGTHCERSSQIGLVRVTSVERYKGGTRVGFTAGPRGRAALAAESDVLVALGRDFTCAPADVPNAVEKLRRELGDARDALGRARARVAQAVADELIARARESGDSHLIAAVEDAPVELLRAIATRLAVVEQGVALLAGPSRDGTPVVVVRGPASRFDCGAFLRRAAEASGGRGGGRPERAEGRLPAAVDWAGLVAAILAQQGAA
jgi:alanyl-tRNA synthetase